MFRDPGRINRPAAENMWYQLATIAGEPEGPADNVTIQRNRNYWNQLAYSSNRKIEFEYMPKERLSRRSFGTLQSESREPIERILQNFETDLDNIWQQLEFVDFSNLDFENFVSFDGFIFPVECTFRHSNFKDSASFRMCDFLGSANFRDSIFQGTTFAETHFYESANFRRSKFFYSVEFTRCNFHGSANFFRADFEGHCTFNSAIFEGTTSFAKANFSSAPEFFESKLFENTNWLNVDWPEPPTDESTAGKDVRCFERLGLVMNGLQKHEDEHRFFRLANRAKRVRDDEWLPNLINWFYEFTCDYGHGIGRAVSIWLGWVVFSGFILWGTAFMDDWDPENAKEFSGDQALLNMLDALALSFSNCLGFLGLNRTYAKPLLERFEEPGAYSDMALASLNVIGGIQSVVGVITLFFVLLTLRNRFKMH